MTHADRGGPAQPLLTVVDLKKHFPIPRAVVRAVDGVTFNVLKGEMSIVGPRPERPGFYGRLEKAVPFFAERTAGLRPGITGMAQVYQGYDTCLDDVRKKAGWDHAYALSLTSLYSWLAVDARVALTTVQVMVTGRGQ